MAVLESVPMIRMTVNCNGEALQEYDNDDDQPSGPLSDKTVVKYIESVSDTEFGIMFEVLSSFKLDCPAVSVHFFVDSNHARGMVLSDKKSTPYQYLITGREIVTQEGRTLLSKFKFATIKTVDDSDGNRIERDMKAIAEVGEVKVKIFRAITGEPCSKPTPSRRGQTPDLQEIAEKADKGRGLSHRTCFEPPQVVATKNEVSVTYIDGYDSPFAIFIFKYRSKDALRNLLLIPRTPSPNPVDSLSQGELRRLAAERLLELKVEKPARKIKSESAVKRERPTETGDTVIDLTQTRTSAHLAKRARTGFSGVIDLTDD